MFLLNFTNVLICGRFFETFAQITELFTPADYCQLVVPNQDWVKLTLVKVILFPVSTIVERQKKTNTSKNLIPQAW